MKSSPSLAITINAGLTIDEIMAEHIFTKEVYENTQELSSDLESQFAYHLSGELTLYAFTIEESRAISVACERVYDLLVNSLDILFSKKYSNKIGAFYGKEFIQKHKDFVEYAKYTYENNHEAIYGRFDIAYDFISRKTKGFYEFNGDTPVMLFESTYLQNLMFSKAESHYPIAQNNEYFNAIRKSIYKVTKGKESVGFFGDSQYIEDALTTESLWNAFMESGEGKFFFGQIEDLEYNILYKNTPFHVGGNELDLVYILMPWEEMVESDPGIFSEWKKWGHKTRFLEPAWRWFVANKGIWAWITYLKDVAAIEDPQVAEFINSYQDIHQFLLPSYVEKPDDMVNYVKKPLIGRLSNNIEIYRDGEKEQDSGGMYQDEPMLYQELCIPGGLPGRNNAILGMWIIPYQEGAPLYMEASNLCIREFDNEILSIKNERFMPHAIWLPDADVA